MPCRIAVLLQTPRDEHSAVFQAYSTLEHHFAATGVSLRIVTPADLRAAGAGRLTPIVYPSVVRRWVRQHLTACDLFVFHSYAGWRAAPLCRHAGVPFAVAFHGLEPLYHAALCHNPGRRGPSVRYRLLQEQLMPAFLRRACHGATVVMCLNSMEKDEIVRRGWAPADRVRVVRHGVGDGFFVRREPRAAATHLLFVGQWLPMKGTAALALAADALLLSRPELHLTCAGTLAGRAQVLDGFDTRIRSRVHVHPRVDLRDLPALYAEADIFLLPSLYEGFGRAILEAMAAGLPIVTTRVGVAAETLDDDRSCLFVDAADPGGIVQAVQRLSGDGELRQRLGRNARLAAESYRASKVLPELAALLTSAAAGPVSAVS